MERIMKKVLSIGSVNMDYTVYVDSFPSLGETVFGSGRNIQPGGKGENQIIAAAKSHRVDAYFIGAIGDDNDGRSIKNVLNENGVKAELASYSEVETGNATIIVDGDSENKIIIIGGANEKLSPKDIDLNLIKEIRFWFITQPLSAR